MSLTRRSFIQKASAVVGAACARALPAASVLARRPAAVAACHTVEVLPLAADKVYFINAIRSAAYFQSLGDSEFADATGEKPVITNIPAGVDIFATRPLPHGLRYAPARPPSAGEVFLFRQEAQ